MDLRTTVENMFAPARHPGMIGAGRSARTSSTACSAHRQGDQHEPVRDRARCRGRRLAV